MLVTPEWGDKDISVWSRTAKLKGITTGGLRSCTLSGCTGVRVGVRWPDKKVTYPCSKGLRGYKGGWRIM